MPRLYEFSRRITAEDVENFAALSGDRNPIHFDAAYAATTRFKEPIVPGMLLLAILSGVLGSQFPGSGTIYLRQDVAFKAPVPVGAIVKIAISDETRFTQKNEGQKKHYWVEFFLPEDGGKLVAEGEAVVLAPKEMTCS